FSPFWTKYSSPCGVDGGFIGRLGFYVSSKIDLGLAELYFVKKLLPFGLPVQSCCANANEKRPIETSSLRATRHWALSTREQRFKLSRFKTFPFGRTVEASGLWPIITAAVHLIWSKRAFFAFARRQFDVLSAFRENHFAVDGAEVLAATQQPESTLLANASSMFYNHRNSIAESGGVVSYILQLRENEYCTYKKVRLFVCTFNVNGQSPSGCDLSPLLEDQITPPADLYVFGFQELDLSQQTFLFDTTVREEQWARTVYVQLLKLGTYFEVKRVRLVGIYLLLYASEELYLRNFIRDIDVAAVGTGLLNRLGNKGGVSIRFRIFDSTCCLVNCHFASGVDELERRNQDYRVISKIQFDRFTDSFERLGIFDHDYIFWFGDMNYRLQNAERYMLDRANRNELHTQFLKYDQLADMRCRGLIFQDFKEGAIEFLPTYKYDIGTDNWDSSEKFRVPAWCDRILWSGDGKVRQLLYDSVQPIRLSDHKPVRALFELEAKVVDQQKYKVVFESALKESDRLENEWLPQVALSALEFTFGKVAFLEPQCQTLTITNTGRVPVHFEFSPKPGEQAFCKPWLLVTPGSHKIKVGEKCLVDVQVLIDKETVWAINEGRERLTDILVLHLNQGKDFFITVGATYVRSCFGISLETLANITYPVRGIPTGDLLHLDSPVRPPRKVPPSVPKEVFRLVEYIRQNGLDQVRPFLVFLALYSLRLIRVGLLTSACKHVKSA
ncbi:endonuclease/exonuclease/phosphatase family protein, partial [Trichuris suis]